LTAWLTEYRRSARSHSFEASRPLAVVCKSDVVDGAQRHVALWSSAYIHNHMVLRDGADPAFQLGWVLTPADHDLGPGSLVLEQSSFEAAWTRAAAEAAGTDPLEHVQAQGRL
jgi:hypothetical protein